MEARAGQQGRGRPHGAGSDSGGSNERAPRPGPASAREAAERLVANVTVCKPRVVVKGAGWGHAAGLVGTSDAAFVPELRPQERRLEVEGLGMAMETRHPF